MSRDNPIGEPFIQLAEVESSNKYAMGQAQALLAAHGATYFAHHQTLGKGQRGNRWLTKAGENITMSIILEPSRFLFSNQFVLSAAIAAAAYDFFSSYAMDETKIKWPNDIYWKDRKAGGILIENILQGSEWKYAIVGIGININQTSFDSRLKNPVSLRQITGREYDTIPLAKELCACVERRWRELYSTSTDIIKAYEAHLYKRGQLVKFKKTNTTFSGIVSGINNQGDLLVDRGGIKTLYPYGSIEWIID